MSMPHKCVCRICHRKTWPIGTNLFTAEQARQMIEHMLAAAAAPKAAEPDALADMRALYPDLRQLLDGFVTPALGWSEWDESVRQRLIAWGMKYLTL